MDRPERLSLCASIVATIGIIFLATGIFSLIVQRFHLTGIPTIIPPYGETLIEQQVALVLFISLIGIGAGNIFCAYGLMRLDEWSWWLTMAFCIIDVIIGGVISLLFVIPLAVPTVYIIYYLLQPHVRATYKW
ncbi:MAG: hypothetical protein QXL15_03960 [Candidatus Korarchaeota archaeon]